MVTYVQGCQTLSDTIVVNVGNPSTTIIGDDTLCEGETSLLDAGSFFFINGRRAKQAKPFRLIRREPTQ